MAWGDAFPLLSVVNLDEEGMGSGVGVGDEERLRGGKGGGGSEECRGLLQNHKHRGLQKEF